MTLAPYYVIMSDSNGETVGERLKRYKNRKETKMKKEIRIRQRFLIGMAFLCLVMMLIGISGLSGGRKAGVYSRI